MGGPEMAPPTPPTPGAPRPSRGTPRYSDRLLAPVALLDLAFRWGDPYVGGPEMAPHTPQRSERPGTPVALLDLAFRWGDRHAAQAGGADRGVDRPVLLGVLDEAPHVVGGERSRARRGHRMADDGVAPVEHARAGQPRRVERQQVRVLRVGIGAARAQELERGRGAARPPHEGRPPQPPRPQEIAPPPPAPPHPHPRTPRALPDPPPSP